VAIAGIQPVDLLLGTALVLSVLYMASGEIPSVPVWARIGTACILAVTITHLIVPASASYMSQRYVYVPWSMIASGQELLDNGTTRGLKWLIAALLLPVLVIETARYKPNLLPRIANAWLAGASVSALVAVTDLIGLTSINVTLILLGNATERQAGLTSHPNHLGLAAALAAPLAIRLAMKSRVKGAAILVLLALGAVVSGSRSGQAAFVLAVALTIAWTGRALRLVPVVMLAAGLGIGSLLWIRPNLVEKASGFFRFGSTDRLVVQSNEERSALAQQGVSDFLERPLDGIGLEAIAQAHNIYLQLLASGGLILAAGMLLYFGGVLRAGYAERNDPDPLGACLFIAVIVWLAAGPFGNQIADRYLYFPVALIAGMQQLRARELRKARNVTASSGLAVARAYSADTCTTA
jgi:O-antigen ligase